MRSGPARVPWLPSARRCQRDTTRVRRRRTSVLHTPETQHERRGVFGSAAVHAGGGEGGAVHDLVVLMKPTC